MATQARLQVLIGANTQQLRDAFSGLNSQLGAVGQQMTSIGKKMTVGLTLPILGAATAAFKAEKDFGSSMSKIEGLVGVSSKQVQAWSDDLLALGPALGRTPQELADGLFFVTSAGIKGTEALDTLERAAKASAAGLGETKTVADLTTSAMNAYGIENLNAAQATDILVAAVREGKAEPAELAGAMGSVLPIASKMGVRFDEVAAATAAMTRTGTDAHTATTQLSQILSSLLSPTAEAQKQLSNMGLSAEGLRKQLREEGLLATLQTLQENFEGNDEAAAKVFGNIRALRGIFDLLGANVEDNIGIFERMEDTTGSLDKAFSAAAKTTQFQWDKAMAQLQSTLISFGQDLKIVLLPLINAFTDTLQGVVKWFKSLDQSTRTAIIAFAGIVAAIGPVLVVFGTIASSISSITALAGGLSGAAGGMGVALGGLLGPLGLTVGALAALGVAGFAVSQTMSQEVIPEIQRFGDEVSEATQQAVGSFMDLNDDVTLQLKELQFTGQAVTEEMAASITGNIGQMGDQIVASLEEDKNESIIILQEFFSKTDKISKEEQENIINNVKEGYAQRQEKIRESENKINTIIETASKERRETTTEEKAEIDRIRSEMVDTGIKTLSKGEVESKAILERIKLNHESLSQKQAIEVIKNSKKTKDETIKEAEKMRDGVIEAAIIMRDETGDISAGQAQIMIDEAEKTRKETVSKAKDMHTEVIKQANKHTTNLEEVFDISAERQLTMQDKFNRDSKTGWREFASIVTFGVTDGLGKGNKITGQGLDTMLKHYDDGYVALGRKTETGMTNANKSVSTGMGNLRQTMDRLKGGLSTSMAGGMGQLRQATDRGMGSVKTSVSTGMGSMRRTIDGQQGSFFSAGGGLMRSLRNGINANTGLVTSAISAAAGLMRRFLPFSPAKEGPLSDLDKLDFGGPIMASIEMDTGNIKKKMETMLALPNINAQNNNTMLTNVAMAGAGGGGGNNITVNVNAGMGANGEEIGIQIVNILKKYERNNGSVPIRTRSV